MTVAKRFAAVALITFFICFVSNDSLAATRNDEAGVCSDGYYYWEVTSSCPSTTYYGEWRKGPSGKGKATLSFVQAASSGYNISVTNTISGNFSSVSSISSALGVSINKSKTYSTSYSVDIPKNKKYQIRYRPVYTIYSVRETRYYKVDGYKTKVGYQDCTVNVFSHWDYDYIEIH